MTHRIRQQLVWDIPTRLLHWLLVGLLGFSWWSAETGHTDWHLYSGLGVCTLVVFRVLWGFIGTSTARFMQFVKGPRTVWSYVRLMSEAQPPALGHNPIGGWSVIALLLLVSAQVVSGLFAVDVDGIESGPLSYFLSFEQGRMAASIHKISFDILLALTFLHVTAILFYLIAKRRNLILAMITGRQPSTADGHHKQTVVLVSRWRVVVAVMMSVLLGYAVAKGFQF